MSSEFPSSQIGLPSSLKYDLPPSLPESSRCYSVHVAPEGITTLTGPALPTNVFVANSTGSFGPFTSQVVSFTIPSGMGPSVFLDPASTFLSFTLTYSVATASTGQVAPFFNLIGSGASFFDQLVLYSNNVPIETIGQYGLLNNFLLNNTVNFAERYGGLSVGMGCDTNHFNGIDLAHSAIATYRYNFSIPLISVIGVNTDKFIPIGSISNLNLQIPLMVA